MVLSGVGSFSMSLSSIAATAFSRYASLVSMLFTEALAVAVEGPLAASE